MINFRCWYCNRGHSRPESERGSTFACVCEYRLRVPNKSGGNSKSTSVGDWLIATLVYGGGGAVLGFGLAFLLLVWVLRATFNIASTPIIVDLLILTSFSLTGLLIGVVFGERGITWIGEQIRGFEDRLR